MFCLGDKVRVKKEFWLYPSVLHPLAEMKEYENKISTVLTTEMHWGERIYMLERFENGYGRFLFADNWLELVEDEIHITESDIINMF